MLQTEIESFTDNNNGKEAEYEKTSSISKNGKTSFPIAIYNKKLRNNSNEPK